VRCYQLVVAFRCVVVILPEVLLTVSLLYSRSGHVSWFAIAVTTEQEVSLKQEVS
jgi:hypothetical protein